MQIIESKNGRTWKYVDRLELGEHATFVPNKKLPVYRWFYYKEGFSRELIFYLIDRFQIKGKTSEASAPLVLDPFCGSGTTLLACKEKGINSIGFDTSELAAFASNVKTQNYDPQELKEDSKELFRGKFQPIVMKDTVSLIKRAFSKYALDDIVFFKNRIRDLNNRNFFLLALINAAMKVSYAWKDGGVIKIKKHPAPPLRIFYKRVVKNMIKDLDKMQKTDAQCIVDVGDARRLRADDNSIDAVITSPPYLNNIDYTKVYAIEEWIANLHDNPYRSTPKGVSSLRSYIGYGKPNTPDAYFEDMNDALLEMFRVLKQDGRAVIVVGNAYVNGEIINSDELLAQLAEKIGFSVKEIAVLNKRYALENRTNKKGVLRESMIVLEK